MELRVSRQATESRVTVRDPIYRTDIGQVPLRPVVLQTREELIQVRSDREQASSINWLAFG